VQGVGHCETCFRYEITEDDTTVGGCWHSHLNGTYSSNNLCRKFSNSSDFREHGSELTEIARHLRQKR
jgi:hypothetical protein